jgi:zinc transporter 7
VGFAAFFFMEKTLRVLAGDSEGSAGHSHSHKHGHDTNHIANAETTAVKVSTSENGLRSRKNGMSKEQEAETSPELIKPSGPSKLSAYLNLFGDFVHNM